MGIAIARIGHHEIEQAGPRGRIVLRRNTVDGRTFCTAHKSQTVYHGPVVYTDDPVRRLEGTSSDLELLLLLVFTKHAAHHAQREYRFLVWAEDDPAEDVVDFAVSPALVDAMWKPHGEPFDSNQFTTAHYDLPFDSRVRVRNLNNDREVELRVNDRVPLEALNNGRILDVSYACRETA